MKATAVKGSLKNIIAKNDKKITEVDKMLDGLQEKIRLPVPVDKPDVSHSKSDLPTTDYQATIETQKKSEEAVEELSAMLL